MDPGADEEPSREELASRVDQLEQTVSKMLPDRRGVIKGLGAAAVGGAAVGASSGGASGQEATGQIGTPDDRVDVFANNYDVVGETSFDSVSTDEVSISKLAEPSAYLILEYNGDWYAIDGDTLSPASSFDSLDSDPIALSNRAISNTSAGVVRLGVDSATREIQSSTTLQIDGLDVGFATNATIAYTGTSDAVRLEGRRLFVDIHRIRRTDGADNGIRETGLGNSYVRIQNISGVYTTAGYFFDPANFGELGNGNLFGAGFAGGNNRFDIGNMEMSTSGNGILLDSNANYLREGDEWRVNQIFDASNHQLIIDRGGNGPTNKFHSFWLACDGGGNSNHLVRMFGKNNTVNVLEHFEAANTNFLLEASSNDNTLNTYQQSTPIDIGDNGDRNIVNGWGYNDGDPSVGGAWNGNGFEGAAVVDATNSVQYVYRNGSWVS